MQSGTPLHIALLRKISTNQKQRTKKSADLQNCHPIKPNILKSQPLEPQIKKINIRTFRKQSVVDNYQNICLSQVNQNITGWFVDERPVDYTHLIKRHESNLFTQVNSKVLKSHNYTQLAKIPQKICEDGYQQPLKIKTYNSTQNKSIINQKNSTIFQKKFLLDEDKPLSSFRLFRIGKKRNSSVRSRSYQSVKHRTYEQSIKRLNFI